MQYNINLDNPLFFTSEQNSVDNSKKYSVPLPYNWHELSNDSEWTIQYPIGRVTERQGWKVHVSSSFSDSHEILSVVANVCHELNVSFKYLSTERNFILRNGKLVDRGFSGKFITCYPDQSKLELFLNTLEPLLERFHGPYILNDKRWKKGPIYLRYGVFRPSLPDQEVDLKIDELLVSGKIVKDVRGPSFVVPEGIKLPKFLEDWVKISTESAESELPFTVDSVIKFSNNGGVYKAILKQNHQKMILREVRPYTGLDFNEIYASDRLESEKKALTLLSDVHEVPNVCWSGQLWEHKFLGVQHMDGIPLNRWVTHNFPIYRDNEDVKRDYLSRSQFIIKQLISIVNKAHSKDVYHQDIHVANILVSEDNQISLVDWEQAVFSNEDEVEHQVAAPGFTSWGKNKPSYIDWYGVKQVAHYLYLPLIIQSDLVYGYGNQTRKIANNLFQELSYPEKDIEAIEKLLNLLGERVPKVPVLSDKKIIKPFNNEDFDKNRENIEQTILSLIRGLDLVSNKWKNVSHERLFPVHFYGVSINQGIAFSDLGILWSLNKITSLIDQEHWSGYEKIKDQIIRKAVSDFNTSDVLPGLFDGIAGTIWLIYELGEEDKARQLFAKYMFPMIKKCSSKTLYNGKAGVLLVGLYLIAKSKDDVMDAEVQSHIYKELDSLATEYKNAPQDFCKVGASNDQSNDPYMNEAGLLYGHAGLGWLFGEAYRFTSDKKFKDCLNLAIETELRGYEYDQRGALQYQQGHRMLPYLSNGSAGVLLLIGRNREFINR